MLIYISMGNIPTLWAHSFQMMKMAEALAVLVGRFQLITQMNPFRFLRYDREELNRWYDIHRPFDVRRLPVYFGSEKARKQGYDFPFFSKMAVLYAKIQPHAVVYTRSIYVAYLSVLHQLPTILETHVAREWDQFKYFKMIVFNQFLRGVVISSAAFKSDFLDVGLAEEKLLVWPNAVDLGAIRCGMDQKILRQRYGIPSNKFVATYAGHLYPHKGIETILKCAQFLPDVLFIVVGGWDEDVAAYKSKWKALSNVDFRGFVDKREIPSYLIASDLLLMPNRSDTPLSNRTPLKMFEYMASMRPLIASDLPEFHEFLNDQNAVLINPDDPVGLKDAVLMLQQNPSYGNRIAQQAYQTAKHYTWQRRAQEILQKFAPEEMKIGI
jgi:glycosyltransferase involved in cell wall biosynthesis